MTQKSNKAIILFNLGGPSSLNEVRPFLFNLFYDPAIFKIYNPFRYILAKFISSRRSSYAKKIYEQMGGKSPINEFTKLQAHALENSLNLNEKDNYKVFYTMRYSPPFAKDVIKEVESFHPEEIILLPLYPQYSTTTTYSSLKQWKELYNSVKTHVICCYPVNDGFIDANVDLINIEYKKALKIGSPRVLFSAHGIPLNRIKSGDPYEMHIQSSVKSIINKLNICNLDYRICYQSKVGPLKWLEPTTDSEIIKACQDKVPIIIVPIAFVSEHSETLVELDIQYKDLAVLNNSLGYFRVSTVLAHPYFIEGLTKLCLNPEIESSIKVECMSSNSKCYCNASM